LPKIGVKIVSGKYGMVSDVMPGSVN